MATSYEENELPPAVTVIRSKTVASSPRPLKRLGRGVFNNAKIDREVNAVHVRDDRQNGMASWRGKSTVKAAIEKHAMKAIRALTQAAEINPSTTFPNIADALYHTWAAAELIYQPSICIVVEGNFGSGKSTMLSKLSMLKNSAKNWIVSEPSSTDLKSRIADYKKAIGLQRFVICERSPGSVAFSTGDFSNTRLEKTRLNASLVVVLQASVETCKKRKPNVNEGLIDDYENNFRDHYPEVYPNAEIVSISTDNDDVDKIFSNFLTTIRYFGNNCIPEIL